ESRKTGKEEARDMLIFTEFKPHLLFFSRFRDRLLFPAFWQSCTPSTLRTKIISASSVLMNLVSRAFS
ncbi:MAG: hypothetical protein V4507_02990, partial [Verrucomicrobiota bacterium]